MANDRIWGTRPPDYFSWLSLFLWNVRAGRLVKAIAQATYLTGSKVSPYEPFLTPICRNKEIV